MELEVFFENENVILVNKPFGLQVEPDKFNFPNLLDWAHKKNNLSKEKTYYLVNRLDRPTSGIVLVAKNKSTYKFLQEEWSKDYVVKKYYALVHGHLKNNSATLNHFLEKKHNIHKALIHETESSESKKSILIYKVIKEFEEYSLLDVQILTGRYHQIRAQLSHIGNPIWNDTNYGAPKNSNEVCIGLHCYFTSIKLGQNSPISEFHSRPNNHPVFDLFEF